MGISSTLVPKLRPAKYATEPPEQMHISSNSQKTVEVDFMDWLTMLDTSEFLHSTPLPHRPRPTESPNVSIINTPLTNEILLLDERLAKIFLN